MIDSQFQLPTWGTEATDHSTTPSNPALLSSRVFTPQELGKSNPELLTQINAHHQDFLRLLTESPDHENEAGMEDAMAEMMGAMGGDGDEGQVVELTEADASAVERLQSLGECNSDLS